MGGAAEAQRSSRTRRARGHSSQEGRRRVGATALVPAAAPPRRCGVGVTATARVGWRRGCKGTRWSRSRWEDNDDAADIVGWERMTTTHLGFHRETSPSPSSCPHWSCSTTSLGYGVPKTVLSMGRPMTPPTPSSPTCSASPSFSYRLRTTDVAAAPLHRRQRAVAPVLVSWSPCLG